MRVLAKQDIEKLISMREVIALMEEVFSALTRGEAVVPERIVLPLEKTDNAILFMPGALTKSRGIGTKAVSVFPSNADKGLPTISAQVLLCDYETGEAKAILEGSHITALRTGATTAVATKYLARKDARNLGVFGAGVQARSQIMAHLEVRSLKRIMIYDPNTQKAAALAQEVQSLAGSDCECSAEKDARELPPASDIIITATTSHTPVVEGRSVKEGTHINAIGSYKAHVREVDDVAIRRSLIFVDSYQHALKEAGDLIIPLKSGIISKSDIRGELGELVLGRKPGREWPDDITFFKCVGIAVQDIAVAEVVYRKACDQGIGLVV